MGRSLPSVPNVVKDAARTASNTVKRYVPPVFRSRRIHLLLRQPLHREKIQQDRGTPLVFQRLQLPLKLPEEKAQCLLVYQQVYLPLSGGQVSYPENIMAPVCETVSYETSLYRKVEIYIPPPLSTVDKICFLSGAVPKFQKGIINPNSAVQSE